MIAYEDTDERSYVSLEAYQEQAWAIEALQETARAFQLERTELQAQLQEAEANAAVALKMLTEARRLVQNLVDLGAGLHRVSEHAWVCSYCNTTAEVGRRHEHTADCPITKARAWLNGAPTPAAPDDRQRLGDNVAYWLQVVLGGVQLDVGKRRHAERALREWMGGDESTSTP